MRALTLLLILSVATATSAGCFGKDDDPPASSTPTTGMTPVTGTPPTGATPATPTAGTNTTPTPTKPAPREVFSGNAAFAPAPGAPDPADPTSVFGPPVNNPFTVPTGYTTLTLNVTWSNPAPAAVVSGLSVTILDAAGATIATCSVPQGAVQGVPAACSQSGTIPATGGDYNAQYHGSAPPQTVTAAVQVIAS